MQVRYQLRQRPWRLKIVEGGSVEWRETLTERVLRHGTGLDELPEIVGATGFRSDARQAVAAERLASDDGTGDGAVDIDVAGAQLGRGARDVRRRARDNARGERVVGGVADGEG